MKVFLALIACLVMTSCNHRQTTPAQKENGQKAQIGIVQKNTLLMIATLPNGEDAIIGKIENPVAQPVTVTTSILFDDGTEARLDIPVRCMAMVSILYNGADTTIEYPYITRRGGARINLENGSIVH